jgi:hypothetical protein
MKPWYQSKTIWFNVLTFVSVVLAAMATHTTLPPVVLEWALVISAAINCALRLTTKEPVVIRKAS